MMPLARTCLGVVVLTGGLVAVLTSSRAEVRAAADPCATPAASSLKHVGAPPDRVAAQPGGKAEGSHSDRGRHLDTLWTHRAALRHRHIVPSSATHARTQDVGEIAVLHDGGDLVIQPNPFDLAGSSLRFAPSRAAGYDVTRREPDFRMATGASLPLGDDEAVEVQLPFEYPFYGRRYSNAFVSSDGNITFGQADGVTGSRTVSRLLSGPPRIAIFLADLDPTAGGRIIASGDSSAFSVTWCGVNGFESEETTTVQATLRSDGSVEMHFAENTTLRDAVVGISPGRTFDFAPVDLTADRSTGSATQGIGERFASEHELDLVAVSRRFLSAHPDNFDSLVVFSDVSLLRGAFAIESAVKNEISGLNSPLFDISREHGSGGRLQSIEMMDALTKWPDDPHQRFRGENSTLSILGQEVGHRWLAFIEFRDHTGQRSDALLGRDRAHWSFFFDSDGSVVEGNDIQDLGDGSFRTVGAVERYSLLDQYAMGLVEASEVPPFFYVENPRLVNPARERESAPRRGVTLRGTRRDVSIDDVIAVLGPRTPSVAESPRVWRQAFLYIVTGGREVDPAEVEKMDRIRVAWEQFFSRATDSRMQSITSLSASRR